MATLLTATSTPRAKKRVRGLTVTLRALANNATPLSVGCFYGVMIVLLLAPLYPAMTQANFESVLQTTIMAGILGGHVASFSSFSAFLAIEVFSSIYGLLFGGFIAWIGGSALPITIEDGTLDLALSRPLSRTRYYLEHWLGVLIGALILGLVIMGSVWIDTLIVKNANIDWHWLWITELVQWAFLFFTAGVGMLCGSCLNSSRAAGGTAVGLIVVGYMLNTFGDLSDQFSWMLKISPFHYAPAIDPLLNHQLTWWNPWLLVAIGLVCGIIGLIIFNKRDLPTL
ncbi:MAG TPA: ABC transporter permease subunit [Ktedonobacteraceae bacterium]|jgi:ABC-2 type transport system permease protein